MEASPKLRIAAATAIIAAACGAALLVEAAIWGAILGLVAGAAALLIISPSLIQPAIVEEAPPPAEDGKDQARVMIDALGDPMMLLHDGRILAANASAKAMLGSWIEGQDVRLALRHPDVVEHLLRAPREGPDQIEVEGIVDPDRRWMVTVAPLGGGARMIHLSDRSAAIAAEKMRVDFVANASHELRTPLATMLGFIETLQDERAGDDRATRSRFLEIMQGEGKRMQQLIDDLMSLSRIEADRFRAPGEPVDLLALAEEVRAGCAQLFAEKRSELVVENQAAGTTVAGDRGQLLQLLRNLVVNALKYGRDEMPVTVRFEDAAADRIRMSVIDRGEGIAPEHLPRLTERFYRVDAGRSRAVGGTGLGLAIVKHIVGRHRGTLDIRSKLGEGTNVQVELPRLAALSQN